ncbi:hypothetical protein ONZ45_g11696 [Pleurotus djamor]|nr:hypothetical protein ONZ45_g11696 [Pleurotus djamor]
MDPLTLTTSIIELGLMIKESIDKFARCRSHAKELASHVVVDLQRIEGFFEKNQTILSQDKTLGPLRDSLDLYHVHKRCQFHEPRKNDTKYKRLVSVVKLWMESDEIEADLVRIKERIQTSMNCISLLSNGRVEVRVAKMEGILVNMYEGRRRIQQFDSAFTQGLLGGDPGLGAFDRSPSELERIDIQYIHVKAEELIHTISRATLTIGGRMFGIPTYSGTNTKPAIFHIIFRTAELQALAHSENTPIIDFCQKTLDLIDMLEQLEMMGILLRILRTVENRLRQALRLGTGRVRLPRHIQEEEEGAFDYLQTILYYQNYYYTLDRACDPSAAYSICEEDVERASESIQFSRSRLERMSSPSNYHRMNFLDSLLPSIYYHSIRGQVEECFSYCAEALEVIQPCIASTTRKKDIIHAGALQSQVGILYWFASAQARNGDYTSAYYTGTECFSSLVALSNIDKSLLPDNFDYLPEFLGYLQEEMPTWTSVVRNPERRTSYIDDDIDDDNTADDSTRLIVWGEAL